ncbi:MAG: hypothetical protein ACAI43_18995 [Phycisphaerae bacterium]|nr:zinc ribbon domain-containing protein [Tepidisphaeraceae bacterium]
MSTFNPTRVSIERAPVPDQQAWVAIDALSRPLGLKTYWGVTKTMVAGVLTFGLSPVFAWVKGFHKFCAGERLQFLHMARWVKGNSTHALATRLENDADELRPRGFLSFLTIVAALSTLAGVWYAIDQSGHMPEHLLIAGTYGYERTRLGEYLVRSFADESHRLVFAVWTLGLLVTYGLHWLQVMLHAADVRRFVARFSQVAEGEGVNRVRAEPVGTTIRPLWMAGAGALIAVAHAPWGLLMMLAGAAHRRYITVASRNTRAELAQRLRTMLERRRPGVALPVPVYLRERCMEAKCRAELPRGANFCRRCGTRQRQVAVV